jgi:D-alanyl-D-alanine dipeptidase
LQLSFQKIPCNCRQKKTGGNFSKCSKFPFMTDSTDSADSDRLVHVISRVASDVEAYEESHKNIVAEIQKAQDLTSKMIDVVIFGEARRFSATLQELNVTCMQTITELAKQQQISLQQEDMETKASCNTKSEQALNDIVQRVQHGISQEVQSHHLECFLHRNTQAVEFVCEYYQQVGIQTIRPDLQLLFPKNGHIQISLTALVHLTRLLRHRQTVCAVTAEQCNRFAADFTSMSPPQLAGCVWSPYTPKSEMEYISISAPDFRKWLTWNEEQKREQKRLDLDCLCPKKASRQIHSRTEPTTRFQTLSLPLKSNDEPRAVFNWPYSAEIIQEMDYSVLKTLSPSNLVGPGHMGFNWTPLDAKEWPVLSFVDTIAKELDLPRFFVDRKIPLIAELQERMSPLAFPLSDKGLRQLGEVRSWASVSWDASLTRTEIEGICKRMREQAGLQDGKGGKGGKGGGSVKKRKRTQ